MFLNLKPVKFGIISSFANSFQLSIQMKNRPIHENLDTSYVNLSALVRYLRRRQFVGNVRVELSGYEADIAVNGEDQMLVREHDRIAGRVSEGDEALQRLLIRAREPGGIINVYQSVEEEKIASAPEKLYQSPEKIEPNIEENTVEIRAEQKVVSFAAQLPLPNGHSKNGNHTNGNNKNENQSNGNNNGNHNNGNHINENHQNGKTQAPLSVGDLTAPNLNSREFPFELSNSFEARARKTNLAPQDWQTLLNLTAELLSAVDKILAEANLEFPLAFEKARMEISADYPFMNPRSGIFDYRAGKIVVREQINASLFVASINEILRGILDKLGRNPKFSNVYLLMTHKILALIEKRKALYDKFSITPQLARTIGI